MSTDLTPAEKLKKKAAYGGKSKVKATKSLRQQAKDAADKEAKKAKKDKDKK